MTVSFAILPVTDFDSIWLICRDVFIEYIMADAVAAWPLMFAPWSMNVQYFQASTCRLTPWQTWENWAS